MNLRYTDEEANDILWRAIEKTARKDAMSREQLESIALEIGVSAEGLLKAESDLARETSVKTERRAFIAGRRKKFLWHSLVFAAAAALLVPVYETTFDPGIQAVIVAGLVAWGAGVAIHGFRALQTRGIELEGEFAAWRQRRAVLSMTDDQLDILARAWNSRPNP